MNRIRHTEKFQISRPVDVVFPLFSPEGEKRWVPGWDYRNVMGDTTLREDYVFVTESHDHAAGEAIWIVKRYEPENYCVEFYKVEAGEKVGVVSVRCVPVSDGETEVWVAYEYIALTEKGRGFIETFTEDAYKEFIGEWKRLLEAYFLAV
ncbi:MULTISPECIES: hypothetical protein [Deferrisoma]